MEAVAKPKMCVCTMACNEGTYWIGRGLLTDCIPEGETCTCWCHAIRVEFAAARKRYDEANPRSNFRGTLFEH